MMKLTVLILCFNLVSYSLLDICRVLLPELQGTYQGRCRNGLAHGRGSAEGVDSYEGVFRKGLPHGEGTYTWANGDVYVGEWKRGERHGFGMLTDSTGDTLSLGIWNKDEFVRLAKSGQEKRPYEIFYSQNTTRVRFVRIGDGNQVFYKIDQAGGIRPISQLSTHGTSGQYITHPNQFGYENVLFPFQGKIIFSAPSKSGHAQYLINMLYVINEPGSWEVWIMF